MDFENLQETLDALVLDKKLGILKMSGPLELSAEEFIGLLQSGEAYDLDLNQQVNGTTISYYHVANYRGVEFLTQTDIGIYDE